MTDTARLPRGDAESGRYEAVGMEDTGAASSEAGISTAPGRLPTGSECQCVRCGLFFTGESAFERHWTKRGHVHPDDVGLVKKQRKGGTTWGRPGEYRP